MKVEKEVQKLFRNISDSIEKTSIEELNSNLSNYLLTKNDRSNDVNIVLKNVAEDYGITMKSLMDKNVRGVVQDAKQTAYYILHCGLNLSIGYIASKIFINNKASVWIGIKRYKQANLKIIQDKEFVERADKLKEIILEKIRKND